MKLSRLGFAFTMLLAASSVSAGFRAADMVIIPAAAYIVGLNSSDWRTDVEITNVDTVAVDVEVVLLPSGFTSNALWFNNIANHLGGRTADGFGHINDKLKDIAPGATVTIDDIIKTTWGAGFTSGVKGALLIFAFEANSFTQTAPPGGRPKKVVVNSRTYNLGKNADDEDTTYGQQVPGIPWYDYIDPHQQSRGFDHMVFTGIREDASYRTAIGLVNISDRLTSVQVGMKLTAPDGTVLEDRTILMLPLAHTQYDNAVLTFFGLPLDPPVVGAKLTVSVLGWQSSADAPVPALIAYVSRIDNNTNDPVFIEGAWEKELSWECVYNGECNAATGIPMRPGTVRPLSPPTP